MEEVGITRIYGLHHDYVLRFHNVENWRLMTSLDFVEVGLSTTQDQEFRSNVVFELERELQRCHILCVVNL
jgi:hypothetical protein